MNGRICFAKHLIHPVLKQLKLNRVFLPTADNKYIDKLVFKKGAFEPCECLILLPLLVGEKHEGTG